MAYDPQKVIAVAISEIGYHEKKSNKDLDDKTANSGDKNYTKYARDLDALGFYNGRKQSYAYCDVFADWCYYKAYGYEAMAKLTNQPAGSKSNYGAGCTYSRRYFKQMGRLFDYPEPGDQIFFYSGGDIGNTNQIAHTGIVEKVDKTYVYTIEGNTSNKVARRKYKLTDAKIAGYGRPNWECDGVPAKPATEPETKPETPTTTTKRQPTPNADPAFVWRFLMDKIGNAYGVAGLMGNLKAESALRATNLQQSYEKKLGYTDETYTQAVDDGKYSNFAKDSAGYGLAQWTSSGRKAKLLAYAQPLGSIGNLETQLEFLIVELSGSYKSVYNTLKTAKTVREASDAVLLKYEIPAARGETVQIKRASYGEDYLAKYGTGSATTPTVPDGLKKGDKGEAVAEMQRALVDAGQQLPKYGVDGDFGSETLKALKAFQASAGLTVSGVYDAATREALEAKRSASRVVIVTGGAVNTRLGPGTENPVYKVVRKDTRLPYVRTDETTGWHLVFVDGVQVWISPKYSKVAQV